MGRWRSISLVAVTVAVVVAPARGALAQEMASRERHLLRLDGPLVDITVLAQENLHGQGLPVQGLFSGPVDFGVILWDEVKPGQPSPPPPQSSSVGQGQSNLNGTFR